MLNRPGLIAALDYLRFDDTLCVWRKLDRLDRSVKEVFTFADDLHDKHIALQSLTGTLSGTYRPTGEGKFFFTMMATFAAASLAVRLAIICPLIRANARAKPLLGTLSRNKQAPMGARPKP